MSTKKQRTFLDFGELLSFLLDRHNVSQTWLADNIPADKADVSRYANGKRVPQKKRIRKIQALLGEQIQKKPTGEWALIENENVAAAATLLSDLDERAADHNNGKQAQDDPQRMLERAVQLIRKVQDQIDSSKKG